MKRWALLFMLVFFVAASAWAGPAADWWASLSSSQRDQYAMFWQQGFFSGLLAVAKYPSLEWERSLDLVERLTIRLGLSHDKLPRHMANLITEAFESDPALELGEAIGVAAEALLRQAQ